MDIYVEIPPKFKVKHTIDGQFTITPLWGHLKYKSKEEAEATASLLNHTYMSGFEAGRDIKFNVTIKMDNPYPKKQQEGK